MYIGIDSNQVLVILIKLALHYLNNGLLKHILSKLIKTFNEAHLENKDMKTSFLLVSPEFLNAPPFLRYTIISL